LNGRGEVDFGGVDGLGPPAVGHFLPAEVDGQGQLSPPPVEDPSSRNALNEEGGSFLAAHVCASTSRRHPEARRPSGSVRPGDIVPGFRRTQGSIQPLKAEHPSVHVGDPSVRLNPAFVDAETVLARRVGPTRNARSAGRRSLDQMPAPPRPGRGEQGDESLCVTWNQGADGQAWNESWNEKPARPGDMRDFRALGGDIGAGRGVGTPGQATCKRQASGSRSAQLPSQPEMSARSGARRGLVQHAPQRTFPQRDVLAGEHLLNVGAGTRLARRVPSHWVRPASPVGKSCGPAAQRGCPARGLATEGSFPHSVVRL